MLTTLVTLIPGTAGAAPATAVATFRVPVGGAVEHYRVRLTESDDIATARGILAGALPRMIPNGAIIRGTTEVNKGYTWHIDSKRFVFTPYALSICNVSPSQVERLAFLRDLCPWSAQLESLTFTR
ncbi:BP74-related protein [Actinokineospora sp. 24-640]